jgi:hypothetical protein
METDIKRILAKIISVLFAILAVMGKETSLNLAPTQYIHKITEVRNPTPLYLKLGTYVTSQRGNQKQNIGLSQQWFHYSHAPHHLTNFIGLAIKVINLNKITFNSYP